MHLRNCASFLKNLLDRLKKLSYFRGNATLKTRLLLNIKDFRQNCFKVVIIFYMAYYFNVH